MVKRGSTRDRARGALVGLAAGDAVGTTVEFRSPGSFEPLTEMVGGGPFALEPYAERWAEIGSSRRRKLDRIHHPIQDLGVTTPEGYDAIVADMGRELGAGRPIYVHCWGGVGRTGTVVGCWHVSRGASADDALAAIARARQGTRKAKAPAPEMPWQVEAIREAEIRRG